MSGLSESKVGGAVSGEVGLQVRVSWIACKGTHSDPPSRRWHAPKAALKSMAMYVCLCKKGQLAICESNCSLWRDSEIGAQKLGGAAESGGKTILRGRPSSADFLSGEGWLGLAISGCHAAACSRVLGVPNARSASDQPMDVHGSTSMFGEACGRALAGGARGSNRT